MKVLVISDTHGYLFNAKKAIELNPDTALLIHLGDNYADAVKLSQIYSNIRFEYCRGNCDAHADICEAKTINIENRKVFVTHGHTYSVKLNYRKILEQAVKERAEIVLFGHTHVAVIDNINNILLVNPGSISQSRSNLPESYCILEISKDSINPQVVYI